MMLCESAYGGVGMGCDARGCQNDRRWPNRWIYTFAFATNPSQSSLVHNFDVNASRNVSYRQFMPLRNCAISCQNDI